jgi:hypothetical protein
MRKARGVTPPKLGKTANQALLKARQGQSHQTLVHKLWSRKLNLPLFMTAYGSLIFLFSSLL